MPIAGIDNAETYSWDLELFEKLKLKPFRIESKDYWKKHLVGRVKRGKAYVDVRVECCPAQFWQFEGVSTEGKAFCLQTGSGDLSEYWPVVEKFLEGLVEFKIL